ncbi:MAG: hypothetical protein SF029_06915 [bacterium]|nr:hypothetical protein [bacterium]
MNKTVRWLLALTALIPLLGVLSQPPDVNLLIYSLFVLVYLARERLQPFIAGIPLSPLFKLFILIYVGGLLSESLVWWSNTASGDIHQTGFYTDYGTHITSYFGFYLVVALIWTVVLRFFRFTILQVFLTAGVLFGVVIEQRGAILLAGLASMPAGLVLWLYVALVYGSYPALAYTLVYPEFEVYARRETVLKYPLVILLLWGVMFTIAVLSG